MIYHEQMVRCHELELEMLRLAEDLMAYPTLTYGWACGTCYVSIDFKSKGIAPWVGKAGCDKETALLCAVEHLKLVKKELIK